LQLLRRCKQRLPEATSRPEFPAVGGEFQQNQYVKKLVSMGTQNDPSVNSSVRVLRVSLQAGSLCYFAAAPALSRIPNSIGRGEAKAGAIAYAGGKRSRAKAGAFAYA
jgi:hypothetical protein